MNDALQKQLADLLAKLMAVAGDTAKFASDQIPPLVQEKLAFGRMNETLQFALIVVGFIVAVRLFVLCVRRLIDGEFEDEVGWMIGAVVTGIGGLGFMIGGTYQLEVTLMVWFAPRLYIVEWLRGMVGK